jgi:hypothetical protein
MLSPLYRCDHSKIKKRIRHRVRMRFFCGSKISYARGLQTTDNGLHHASLNLGSNQFCTPQLSRWENPLNLPFRDACR